MKKIILRICFLAGTISMFSCQKSDIDISENQSISPDKAFIAEAKAFFYSDINTYSFTINGIEGERQKVKKVPLWERAVVMTTKKREVVTVPLNYEKKLKFNYNVQDDKLSLENFSNLIIYRDELGNFKAEVVTYLPKENSSEYMSTNFRGNILVEDWGGNHINTFLIENDKQYRYINRTSSQRTTTDDGCLAIHWFICDVVNGIYSNCEYAFTEYTGACYQSLEPCLEGCASDYTDFEEERLKSSEYHWNVTNLSAETGGGYVKSSHFLYAKFNNRRAERDRFIGQSYYAGNAISTPGNAYANLLSHLTYEHSGTVNSNTQMTLKSSGRYTLPDQWYFEYNNSKIIALYSCCNWQ